MKQSEMFREGYYLEVIKAKYSAATAVITVKEKTVEIKNKKITTNKWLTLEDWASLYEVLDKALLQNSQKTRTTEKRKFTRHLEIVYTFEASENPSDRTSLPTIRVGVSPLKKKSRHKSKNNEKRKKGDAASLDSEYEIISSEISSSEYIPDLKVEEYIPDAPNTTRSNANDNNESKIGYVPSRKSTLQFLQQSANSNEYVPSVLSEESIANGALDALYVPNSVPRTENFCETYEPSSLAVATTTMTEIGDEYIPNSKGVRKKVDEYQPDFTSKTMKFDNSYVPSSSQRIKELKKNDRKSSGRNRKMKSREADVSFKESSSSKKSSTPGQSEIKREM